MLRFSFAHTANLKSYLRTVTNLDDSWSTFFSPIKFIGRDVELRSLIEFAHSTKTDHDKVQNILWQVVYGDHAVGKTRIATEWLNYLESQDWATGFIDFSNFQIGEILTRPPNEETAIVIDNTDLASDVLWTFIEAVNQKWNGLNIPVRILLLSHVDIEPQLGNFDRTQWIKNIKQGESIFIQPFTNERDSLKILETVALQFEEDLTKERAKNLVLLTGGRPAFLGLAGAFKENWQNELKNYAREIIKRGETLFSKEGIDLVTLSALAGPVSDEVRQRIAPNTDNILKLTELFAKPVSFVSETVPRIEPDLLANEIVFESLHRNYTKIKRNNLLTNIVDMVPDVCLERITTIWRGSLNLSSLFDLPRLFYNLYGGQPAGEISRAVILESLFEAVALKFDNAPLRSLFTNLYRIRSSTFALTLLREDGDPKGDYASIVNKVFHQSMPKYGLGLYLQEIHSHHLPCTYENRVFWASIIDYVLGDVLWSNEVPKGYLLLDNYSMALLPDDPAELFKMFHQHLSSSNEIEKIYGALKLAGWANGLKMEPDKALSDYETILDDLYTMVQSFEISQIIFGSRALAYLVRGPNEIIDATRIGQRSFEIFMKILGALPYASYAFDSVITAIVTISQTPYHFEHIFKWFKKTDNLIQSENKPPHTNDRIEKLAEMLISLLEHPAVKNETKRSIASGLLKIEKWIDSMEPYLADILFSNATSPAMIQETIIRLFEVKKNLSITFLQKLMEYKFLQNELQYRYMVLAGMLTSGLLVSHNIGELGLPQKIGRVNVLKLIAEIRNNNEIAEEQLESTLLLNLLKDAYMSHRGHYIHKLKAKDTTGRWAYYFVLIEPENELAFLKAIEGDGVVELTDYGSVVASSYGEEPTEAVKDYLMEKYGFDGKKK